MRLTYNRLHHGEHPEAWWMGAVVLSILLIVVLTIIMGLRSPVPWESPEIPPTFFGP